jgi:hypothetical protein
MVADPDPNEEADPGTAEIVDGQEHVSICCDDRLEEPT